jgi:chloride channel protein, CIC family
VRLAPRLFLRANIRYSDLGLTAVAVVIGGSIALGVAVVRQLVMAMHHLLLELPFEMHLSGSIAIAPWRRVAIPCLGGLVYGITAYLLWRWRPRDIVNAIEANALHGGRMSLSDSLRLTALTILSGGSAPRSASKRRSPSSAHA